VITVREGETTADEPNTTPLQILDVGGAGSNFWQTLTAITSETVILVDPNHKQAPAGGAEANIEWFSSSIEDFAAATAHMRFDVATCISVVEHVDIIRPFFRAIHMLLKPGGLLFLTTDFWDSHGPDVAHFHWMRKRIYNEETIKRLLEDLRALGFRSFGESDWSYHGHQLYDYSIASAAMVRK
jgi:SAM-dependent methyltransferase